MYDAVPSLLEPGAVSGLADGAFVPAGQFDALLYLKTSPAMKGRESFQPCTFRELTRLLERRMMELKRCGRMDLTATFRPRQDMLSSDGIANRLERLLIVFLLLFASLLLQSPPCEAASETSRGLDERQRMRIFDKVWQTLQKWYYDPTFGGVDWKAVGKDFRQRAAVAPNDEELHALIAEMVARLNDTHTYYEPPANYSMLARVEAGRRGLEVAEVGGRFVVTAVDPELAALQSGLRPGLALRTVNGQSVEARARGVDALIRRSVGLSSEKILTFLRRQMILSAPAEQPMALEFVDPMGHPVEALIDKALASRKKPPVVSRRLASELGYIRWTTWDPTLTNEIRAHLASLGNMPGLIIDLRGNQGGDPQLAVDVLSCLFKEPVPYGIFYGRISPPKIKLNPCPHTYMGPIAVLMDGESGSTSEIFLNLIQENRRGLLVGQPSAASVVYHRKEEVRGGGRIYIALWGYKSPQGRRLQGTGVVPDVAVEATIMGLWEGRDEILEAAEGALKPGTTQGSGQAGPGAAAR